MTDWTNLPKARRAAVYRAIGRAGRSAREDGDPTIAADLRIAMDLLRTQAKAKAKARTRKAKRPKRKQRPKR